MSDNKKLLVIIGSTSSGKTDLAIKCAKRYNGEVVSADSRQVFKDLNETTGKVTKEEQDGIPHHCIDIVEPGTYYSSHDFSIKAQEEIKNIQEKNKLPIIAGGTGFYIESILFSGATSIVPADPEYRSELAKKDLHNLQEELKNKDIDAYKRIDIKNPQRLIRALEIIRSIGVFPLQSRKTRYEYIMIGLTHSNSYLRDRIEKRLEARFEGMTKEIQNLIDKGIDPVWLDNLGLEARFIKRMLIDGVSKKETKERLFTATWAYAKRQQTWWNRYPEATWYHEHEIPELFKKLDSIYK